jgi:hypothetical protein
MWDMALKSAFVMKNSTKFYPKFRGHMSYGHQAKPKRKDPSGMIKIAPSKFTKRSRRAVDKFSPRNTGVIGRIKMNHGGSWNPIYALTLDRGLKSSSPVI